MKTYKKTRKIDQQSQYKAYRYGLMFFCIILLVSCADTALVSAGTSASSNTLVPRIKQVKRSVVSVGTYFVKDTPKLRFRGTGFAAGDGTIIVTNHHTIAKIEKEKRMKRLCVFHPALPSRGQKATLLLQDETHDLALLKIQTGKLPPLKLADSASVQEGESVAFTGYPIGFILGLNPTTHTGIISAIAPIILPSPKGRAIKKEMVAFLRRPYDIFQIDATAYPGNSGSPVFKISTGEVIGVINMVFIKGKKENLLKDPSGITYAIPANHVRSLLTQSRP